MHNLMKVIGLCALLTALLALAPTTPAFAQIRVFDIRIGHMPVCLERK